MNPTSISAARLVIYLCDGNAEIVLAWRDAFAGAAGVEIRQGDILASEVDALVSPANSFGFMDGGVDLVYARFFGWELQHRVQKQLRDHHQGELAVGAATIVETSHIRFPYLIVAPTMRIPENIATTVNSYQAFRAALTAALAHEPSGTGSRIASLACPGLGTGIGGMPPHRAAKQMRAAFDVVVYGAPAYPSLGAAYDAHHRLIG